MIYNKSIKFIYVFLAIILVLNSCQDNDAELLFEEPVSVRLEKRAQELRDLLVSSPDGWSATYFTDDQALGGYNFLFRFIDGRNVEMASDFSTDLSVTKSEYVVDFGATVQLTFTTKGRIHELSDSNNSPDADLRGQGYKGSFQFSFYGVEGEELIFRDVKEFNEVRFSKASAEDWNSKLTTTRNMLENNVEPDPTKSVFRNMVITQADSTKVYSFSYNSARRFASTVNVDELGIETNINFGIAPTENGILVSPAITVGETEFSSLRYDTTNDEFVAEQDGIKVVVTYSGEPSTPFKGQNILPDWLIPHEPFLNSLAGDWSPDLTNVGFRTFLQNLNASITRFNVTRLDVFDLDSNDPTLRIITTIGSGRYSLNKEIKDDKLFLTLRSTNGLPAFFTDALTPLLNIFLDPNGLYVDQPTSLNAFTNRIFTFVPASDTTILFSAVQI